MDLTVHRTRFVDWSPAGITCLAFPPIPPPRPAAKTPGPSSSKWFGTLAVGRASGNIEVYEWSGTPGQEFAPHAWVLRKVLPAPLRSKVETLAFSIRNPKDFTARNPPRLADLRLFSSGGGTDVVEWDIPSGTILRTYPVHGGSIWSIAVNPSSTLLACGCDDGTVRILNLADNGLELYKTMGPSRGKVLSVAWGPPSFKPKKKAQKPVADSTSETSEDEDEDQDEWIDDWLVSGGSDAALKRWGVRSGSVLSHMRADQVRGVRTLMWAVAVLSDGTIVSGDSMGLVKFWDVKTSTQIKSIRAHDADVLCLAVGSDGTSIFSSGVDQNVTECTLTQTSTEYGLSQEWVKSSNRRLHSHDVRALAIWPPHSLFPSSQTINPGTAPLLVSGGQDMVLEVTPCAPASKRKIINPIAATPNEAISRTSGFAESIQQKLPYPLNGVVSVAKEARLVVVRRAMGISIWRIRGDDPNVLPEDAEGFDRVLDMDLNVTTHLVTLAISDDGRWLAVSDAVEVKLFSIGDLIDANEARPVRVKNTSAVLLKALEEASSDSASAAASKLLFTPDSNRFIVVCSPSSQVVVLDLSDARSGGLRALRTFSNHATTGGVGRVVKHLPGRVGNDDEAADERGPAPFVTSLNVSADGQWLATADDRGRCHVFNLDALQHHCTLPSFELPIRHLIFDPSSPQTLVLAQVNNILHVFDVESRTFPSWAKPLCDNLPERFTGLKPPLEGLLYLPEDGKQRLVAWGWNWLCKIKLDGPALGKASSKFKSRHKKEELKVTDEKENFTMVWTYRQMLAVAHLDGSEIVVVERPTLDLLTADGMPPPFYKHRFGT